MQCGMRTLIKIMAGAGLLAGISHAQAQYGGLKPSWYLVPQVSAFDPDNSYGVRGTGAGGGLLIGAPISDSFDLQLVGEASRRGETGRKIQQGLLGLEGLYLFSRGEIQPFLSLGVGAERDKRTLPAPGPASTSSTSPYASVGFGARWMLSNNFGLQADYRRVEGFLRKSSPWGFHQSGNNYVNLGLVWAYGAEPSRPAPRLVAAPPPVVTPPPPVVVTPPPPPKVIAPPPPPPAPVQRVTLDGNKLFELNSARLVMPVAELDNYAVAMTANTDLPSVTITGHTDQLGRDAYNNRLSQDRADSVKAYLVSKGVAANRLTARGMGSTKLVTVCKEKTRAAMITCGAPNRRVELEPITVVKR